MVRIKNDNITFELGRIAASIARLNKLKPLHCSGLL